VAPKYSRHFTQIPTDGQTDRQTNTFLIASPRWDSMQRGKKRKDTDSMTAALKVRDTFQHIQSAK